MMKKKVRSFGIGLCGVVAAAGLATGVLLSTPETAALAASTPTVTMIAGASARKTSGEPGIKFTAKIDGYGAAGYQYGMLILPEKAWEKYDWDNETDYIAELNEMGVTYANKICGPYDHEESGETAVFAMYFDV